MPGLFRLFSKLATTPQGLLEFVTRFGPMVPDGNREGGEDALLGLGAAQVCQNYLTITRRTNAAAFCELVSKDSAGQGSNVALAFNPKTGRPYFKFKPPSLHNALWIEVGDS